MTRTWTRWACTTFLALAAAYLPTSNAQDFPTRPISLIISFSPGGVTDIVGRMLAEPLGKEMGQPVVVENLPGAGGNIAFIKTAQAAPDGYTLLLASTSTVTNPALAPDKRFDPVKSYSTIGYIGAIPFWLLVNPNRPGPTTVAQLVEQARSASGRMTYGSGGVGTASHLGLEYFKAAEKLSILHVPYKGQSAAVADLLAGTVGMVFMPMGGTEDLVRGGKLKALATTARARVPDFPEVPTFAEAGFPVMDVGGWLGVMTTAGVPPATLDKLRKAVHRILGDPEFRRRLVERGLEPRLMSPTEFSQYIEHEVARWKDVVSKAGITTQ